MQRQAALGIYGIRPFRQSLGYDQSAPVGTKAQRPKCLRIKSNAVFLGKGGNIGIDFRQFR